MIELYVLKQQYNHLLSLLLSLPLSHPTQTVQISSSSLSHLLLLCLVPPSILLQLT